MILSGWPLWSAIILLVAWIAGLVVCLRKQLARKADERRKIGTQLAIAATILSMISLVSLLLLHLTWISPAISQNLGGRVVQALAAGIFLPLLPALLVGLSASGRIRFVALVTSVVIGFWYLILAVGAGLSGSSPIARHSVHYLIPAEYVGWVEVHYAEKDSPPLTRDGDSIVCKFPKSGSISTSSSMEHGWGADQYSYYREDGSLIILRETGWGEGGMIWGDTTESGMKPGTTNTPYVTYRFFVGTEAQYHQSVSRSKP